MSRAVRVCLATLVALVIVPAPTLAVRAKRINASALNLPTHVAEFPGSRALAAVEQGGIVRLISSRGQVRATPILDLTGQLTSGGERGLLSLAFSPSYRRDKRIYVVYTGLEGNIRLESYQLSPGLTAYPSSRKLILEIPHSEFEYHNGGLASFDSKGHLWLGTGDGGGDGDPHKNAQNLDSLLGKLLRIDPHPTRNPPYTVPSSNPFVGKPGRDEIYSYGLRNPWRYSFDDRTRRLVIGDVGTATWEEVDYLPLSRAAGANFGWDSFEGNLMVDPDPVPNYVPPIYTYIHDGTHCAITGGLLVRDRTLRSLYGRYLFADFCDQALVSLRPTLSGARDVRPVGIRLPSVNSFARGARERVYVVSYAGWIYRLVP